MDLTIQDVSKLLQLSEETLLTWVKSGQIPSYQLNQEYRFSREEIEEWMVRAFNQDDLNITLKEQIAGLQQFNLYRAIHKGFVLHDVVGKTKQEIIRNSMKLIAKSLDLDADALTELLMDRERLMSTALNKGIAVPHTRDFLLSKAYDVVAIVYPKEPLDYGALDGQKVHTLFFLFACQDKRHLNLLAKIAYFCHQTEHLELLQKGPEKEQLLQIVRNWESQVARLQQN